jgi:hypothetical protein
MPKRPNAFSRKSADSEKPAYWVWQYQDAPPHRPPAVSANAAHRTQTEHRGNTNHNENEHTRPEAQAAPRRFLRDFTPQEKRTADNDNDRTFERIQRTNDHRNRAEDMKRA